MLRANTRRGGWVQCCALLCTVWACSGNEATNTPGPSGAGAAGMGATDSGGGEGAAPSNGGTSNMSVAGSPDSAGVGGEGEGGVAGAAGGGPGPECTEPSDCALPTTTPEDCAEASCVEGKCVLSARDADSDGFIAKRCQSLDPEVTIPTGDDCDDTDETVSPEGWDGPKGENHDDGCNDEIDQDCSGIVDDGVLGSGATCVCSPGATEACSALPNGTPITFPVLNDGKPAGLCQRGSRECDTNGKWGPCTDAIAPVEESCDELDNDCDTFIDDDAADRSTYFCDADSDEHLALTSATKLSCSTPLTGCAGGVWRENSKTFDDCDDADGDNYPGHAERCDDQDQDCDGLIDEVGANANALKTGFYCDADSDGHLVVAAPKVLSCTTPVSGCNGDWLVNPLASVFNDCNDAEPDSFGTKTEVCDDIDNDCDGLVDEIGANANAMKKTWFRDQDADGFGTDGSAVTACTAPAVTGWVLTGGDCKDTGAGAKDIKPGAPEVCDGVDNDCDQDVDAADGNLSGKPVTQGTTYECQGGAWKITGCPADKLDCNGGLTCEADANSMSSCHACNTACSFQCGAVGCSEVTQLAAGDIHGCAVTSEGKVACWGDNTSGQIGDGSTDQRNNPTLISGLAGATAVSAGFSHTCAVGSPTSTLYCWGSDADGQLGSSSASGQSSSPVAVNSTTSVISVSAGGMHTCAVINGGLVRCWGQNTSGQVGNLLALPAADVVAPTTVRTAASGNLSNGVQVSAGYEHSCAVLSDQTVACWGNNSAFQLGKTGANANSASVVAGLTGVSQVSAGAYHTCAVAGGKVYCWGSNDNLVLGVAGAGPFSSPQLVPSLTDAVAVAAGFETTCVVRSGGSVECWGGNTYGGRGDAPAAASASRTVVGLTQGSAVVVGSSGFACGLRSSKDAYCWGRNNENQLGKTGSDTHVPQLLVE